MTQEVTHLITELLKLLPPQYGETSLKCIEALLPFHKTGRTDLIKRIPKCILDKDCGKYFLCGEENFLENQYRSPWTSKLYPITDAEEIASINLTENSTQNSFFSPSEPMSRGHLDLQPKGTPINALHDMEKTFNVVFNGYKELYMKHGVSSVYITPSDTTGFLATFLLVNDLLDAESGLHTLWYSTHVVEVLMSSSLALYQFISTSYLHVYSAEADDKHNIGIRITETKEVKRRLLGTPLLDSSDHISVIGPQIEALEYTLRRRAEDTFIGRLEGILPLLHHASHEVDNRQHSKHESFRNCMVELFKNQKNNISTK